MDTKKRWIEEGYKCFAYRSPKDIKIERLAKSINKNKSSFYHHFANIEIFIDQLLSHHLGHIMVLAEKNSKAASLDELIDILYQHKLDLLFNRQLRVHRKNPEFQKCFVKTNEIAGNSILGIWSQILKLEDNSYLARLVLKLSVENFFLQITEDTLDPQWLKDYFGQLQTIVREFKNRGIRKSSDGIV